MYEQYKGGNLMSKLVPLGDKVILKQLEAEETTASGIVLPGQSKEKPQKVIYSKYTGTEVKLDDEEFIIVKQSDILAIIK